MSAGSVLVAALAATAFGQGPVESSLQTQELRSPNRRIQFELQLPTAGTNDVPSWSATWDGRPVFADCKLGLVAAGPVDLFAGVTASTVDRSSHDERIAVQFGKADQARDRYEELRVSMQGTGALPLHIVVRCYDDAIAFRYAVGAVADHGPLRLLGEHTSFGLVGNPTLYASYLESFRTSHEHPVNQVALAALPAAQLLDLPLTAAHASGPFLSITEASLRRYAGMSLRRDGEQGPLVAAFAAREDGVAIERTLPLHTPWRVVLLGDRPGALLESNTLYCLNEPPAFDAGWVRPGKITWPWWNGYLFEAERGEPILSLAVSKQHIDWCAEHGIGFHAVVADERDQPWYHQPKKGLFPGPGTDATRVRDGLELAAIRQYATERGVGLWTWVHHGAVRGRTAEVFAAFERLGWNGVMVDFLDRDDQTTVEFAEEVLVAAAKHHVLVHFHGMYKPTGWQRTYPNLMNHEGSLNLEQLKWGMACPPEHDLRVAFTRMVAGPLDYHLGGFRAVPRAKFVAKHTAPNVLGTRGHQLALYVCFDNPTPMVADYPAAYRDQPGFEFLSAVPTWWDETRVLEAEIGQLLVTARRRGNTWYLGGLLAGAARDVALPLSFLGPGTYTLQVWRDAADTDRDPNQLAIEHREVTAKDILRVPVGGDGGFVARLTPRE